MKKFFILAAMALGFAGTVAAQEETTTTDAEAIAAKKADGAKLVTLFTALGTYSTEAQTAWEAVANNDEATLEQVTAAYTALESAGLAPSALDGKHVTLKNMYRSSATQANATWLLSCNPDGVTPATTSGNPDGRTWTLKANTEGTGVILLNEYAQKGLKSNANYGGSHNATLVDPAEASAFIFEIKNLHELVDSTSLTISDIAISDGYAALHCGSGTQIIRWGKNAGASYWSVSVVDERQAASDDFKGATYGLKLVEGATFGTGLGQYTMTPADGTELYNAVKAMDLANAETTTIRNTASQVRTTGLAVNLNMPEKGKFYRFKNVNSGKYMGNAAGSRLPMVTDGQGNLPGDVWFYNNDGKLVSYTTGLCIGKFAQGQSTANWGSYAQDNSNVGTLQVLDASSVVGRYILAPSNGRYLYGANANVDCGNGTDANYSWIIEEVKYLPVPFVGDTRMAAIFTPVTLHWGDITWNGGQRVKIYGASFDDDMNLVQSELNTQVIPANTAVVIELLDNAATENGCVYLEVGGTTEATVENNSLQGSIFSAAMEANQTYYTADAHRGFKTMNTATTVPGFVGYLTVEDTDAPDYVFVATEEEKATIAAEIKAMGDKLVNTYTMLGAQIDETTTNDWTTAKEGPLSLYNLSKANDALHTAVMPTLDGKWLTFRNKYRPTDYINGTHPTITGVSAWGEGNTSRIWKLELNSEQTGYKLYNEYSRKYIKSNANSGNGSNASLVDNANEASEFAIEITTSGDGLENTTFGVYDIALPTASAYLHTASSNNVIRWSGDGEGSQWYLTPKTEQQAASDALYGAKANYPHPGTIGEGVGQYSITNQNIIDALAIENATAETDAMRAGAETLYNASRTSDFALNMPVAGRFYRFQGYVNDNYMANSNNSSNRMDIMADAEGNSIDDIFYLTPDNKLVSFKNGLVLGKFLSTDNKASWKLLPNDNSSASSAAIISASTIANTEGGYFIQASSGRYLYNGNATVDCGGNPAGAGNNASKYVWRIKQVDWVPFAIDATGNHAAVYSPVPFNNGNGRVSTHTVELKNLPATEENGVDENVLVKTAINGSIIPANTPCVVEVTNTSEITNGCIYLPADYSTVAVLAEEEETPANSLTGNIYAQTKENGKKYFVAGTADGSNAFVEHSASENYIPGFTAHMVVDEADAQTSYKLMTNDEYTTGIHEIAVDANASKAAAYDLQGRRVANPRHGLYIINGVKTLVK